MEKFLICAVLLLSLFSACGRKNTGPDYKLQTLPSGKQIRAIGTEVKTFPDGTPALMFKYETELNVEDVPAIREEVTDVWENFRGEAERAAYQRAIVSVQGATIGGSVKGYQYQFERTEEGQWRPFRKR